MNATFEQAALAISAMGRNLHTRGWVPATSGNFSVRIADGDIAITASGRDKSRLEEADIIRLDTKGNPHAGGTPSAETGLHLQLYAREPAVGAVLHTHSLNAVLSSMAAGAEIPFSGLELLKAFPGIDSHEAALAIPVFENDQDMDRLAAVVERHMSEYGQGHAYLIRGHGIYTWGRDLDECLKYLEAMEHLLAYYWKTSSGDSDE